MKEQNKINSIKENILEDITVANSNICNEISLQYFSKLANSVFLIAQDCAEKANNADKSDQKVQILVAGLQTVVNLVEETAANTRKTSSKNLGKVEALTKIYRLLEDQKEESPVLDED